MGAQRGEQIMDILVLEDIFLVQAKHNTYNFRFYIFTAI